MANPTPKPSARHQHAVADWFACSPAASRDLLDYMAAEADEYEDGSITGAPALDEAAANRAAVAVLRSIRKGL